MIKYVITLKLVKSPHRVEFWLFSLKLKVFAFFFS